MEAELQRDEDMERNARANNRSFRSDWLFCSIYMALTPLILYVMVAVFPHQR